MPHPSTQQLPRLNSRGFFFSQHYLQLKPWLAKTLSVTGNGNHFRRILNAEVSVHNNPVKNIWLWFQAVFSPFQTPSAPLSKATGFSAGQRHPERLQQRADEEEGSRVTAAHRGITSLQLGLIWVMSSYYDLAGPAKWLNWFLGLIRQGAAMSYFSCTAYFSRHSRRGGADPFLHISPPSMSFFIRLLTGSRLALFHMRQFIEHVYNEILICLKKHQVICLSISKFLLIYF